MLDYEGLSNTEKLIITRKDGVKFIIQQCNVKGYSKLILNILGKKNIWISGEKSDEHYVVSTNISVLVGDDDKCVELNSEDVVIFAGKIEIFMNKINIVASVLTNCMIQDINYYEDENPIYELEPVNSEEDSSFCDIILDIEDILNIRSDPKFFTELLNNKKIEVSTDDVLIKHDLLPKLRLIEYDEQKEKSIVKIYKA